MNACAFPNRLPRRDRRFFFAATVLLPMIAASHLLAFDQSTSRPTTSVAHKKAAGSESESPPHDRGLGFCILATKNAAKPAEFDEHVRSLRKRGPAAPVGDPRILRWFEVADPVAFLGVNKSDGIRPDDLAKQRILIHHHEGGYFVLGHVDAVHSLGMSAGPRGLSVADVRIEPRPVHRGRTVTLQLDRISSKRLETFTRSYRNREMGVIVDGMLISRFTNQQAITGRFAVMLPSREESERLVRRLKSDGTSPPPKKSPSRMASAYVGFRILARPDPANPNQFEPYIKRLAKRGPRSSSDGQTYRWFPIYNPAAYFNKPQIDKEFDLQKSDWPFIAGRYGDRYFVLAHVDREHSMSLERPDEDGGLKSVSIRKDPGGNPALSLELDDRAAENLHQLTRKNIGRSLTILIDDEAVMFGALMDPLRGSVIISGRFSRRRLEELQTRLTTGIGTRGKVSVDIPGADKPSADESKRRDQKED